MKNRLNIEQHFKHHEDLIKILEMLEKNRRYMLADVSDSHKSIYREIMPNGYYHKKIEHRKAIQARLLTYYAKKLAVVSSDAYNVAMDILKPISSN